ncbi:hypothetical protein G6F65_020357 [Rhizopus arrhizus]|uniref:Uncharacterized protein n=1 Tax=Rhizopus delemar TaxID=936053 RepID=A0A9P6XV04_9FUNG|nr:hypothetical protein G6F65_020357 [Rhizopus arrhizus]KAG1533129.1 hypothetical protein G6F50_015972 [Rhizopus delemar]
MRTHGSLRVGSALAATSNALIAASAPPAVTCASALLSVVSNGTTSAFFGADAQAARPENIISANIGR